MPEFPYVAVPNKLKSFLEDIKLLGIPENVSGSWLKTVGYTSSNDTSIPKVMEFVDFIDSSRKPTEKWRLFRDDKSSGFVLADAIKEGYSTLYQVYPDAHQRSEADLMNFFRTHTEAGDQSVRRTARTFKMLCSLAHFDHTPESEFVPEGEYAPMPAFRPPVQPQIGNQVVAPPVTVDIQIHISYDTSVEQIDQVFASMAKHLYKGDMEAPLPY